MKSLIQSLKNGTTINLLCSLKKENMEDKGVISTLSAKNKNKEYQKREIEEENKKLKEELNKKGIIIFNLHKHESGSTYYDNRQEMNIYNSNPQNKSNE